MKERHIILRVKRASTRDFFLGPSASTAGLEPAAENLAIEVDDMEKSHVSALTRTADVVAVAPVIPMKLISPVEVQSVVQATAQGNAWGVEAVGAHTSPFTGNGVTVAVLDTGIDDKHPAFSGVQLVQQDFTG